MTGRELPEQEGDRHARNPLGLELPKLRGGGGISVAVPVPVTSPPPAAPTAAGEGSSDKPPTGGGRVKAAGELWAPEDDRPGRCPTTGPATQAPAAPHAAAPVGAAGTTPAVPAYGRTDPRPMGWPGHGAADGHGSQWAGAAGSEQPGAREIGRSSPRGAGSARARESARPVSTTAGSCGNTGQPPERAGASPGAPAPPPDYEPWWYCPTCSDGHIGPCTSVTPTRKPLLLRLLDLIGRPA